ncbi:MAG: serine dehydratase subunit alpha family protein [Clostridiales bacterium]|nr:serine dehydratase subunit alpha family protein [Clostridiales bacterium]
MLTKEKIEQYIAILGEELVPAMGCTEPISIAYAAAKARAVIEETPIRGRLEVSGNIVKNAKSVVVPHTGGLRGIKSAFAAGLAVGDAEARLEVLSNVTEAEKQGIATVRDSFPLEIITPEDARIFDIGVTLISANHTVFVRIADTHTNVVCIRKDGEILFEKPLADMGKKTDRSVLNVEDILAFANAVNVEDVKEVLERQIQYNMAIAEEGLKNDYGANIGKVLLRAYQPDIKITAKAYAAAASDARMNGCELPVIINSGSGNQGITASVPVIVYAKGLHMSKEKLYRALCVSNLITIHLKSGIGTLSAYCGVVSAGAGAACGVAYLLGGGMDEIEHTLVNALAIDSGIICDGAKASCAAKIATAVESGLLGLNMYYNGNEFYAGDGIVKSGVEKTINSVSRLAHKGMRETDKEIIRIMLDGE